MELRSYKLSTQNFRDYSPEFMGGVPIRISRGSPRFKLSYKVAGKIGYLMPDRMILRKVSDGGVVHPHDNHETVIYGEIDFADPIGLFLHIFRGAAPPRPPYPERGLDPTPDALGSCLEITQ